MLGFLQKWAHLSLFEPSGEMSKMNSVSGSLQQKNSNLYFSFLAIPICTNVFSCDATVQCDCDHFEPVERRGWREGFHSLSHFIINPITDGGSAQ